MKVAGFHEGDRSEFLADFVLSTVGLTIPVRRQSDYCLVDFIVHPFTEQGRNLEMTGLACNFQIKSNNDPITVKGKERRRCFFHTMLPFFIGVVTRADKTLFVYTTVHRLLLVLKGKETDLRLVHGRDRFHIEHRDSKALLFLSKPIAKVSLII